MLFHRNEIIGLIATKYFVDMQNFWAYFSILWIFWFSFWVKNINEWVNVKKKLLHLTPFYCGQLVIFDRFRGMIQPCSRYIWTALAVFLEFLLEPNLCLDYFFLSKLTCARLWNSRHKVSTSTLYSPSLHCCSIR